MKLSPLRLPFRLAIGAVVLLAPWAAVHAQTTQSAPNLTAKRPHTARSHSDADEDAPDLTQPVATVNGSPVYRPLMHSAVSDPVDRALLIGAYRKIGPGMSAGDKDLAAKQLELTQFNGNAKLLDAKLHALNANRTDFRQFAVEEAKLHEVLRSIARGARSPRQAEEMRAAYVARLRHDASINAVRH